MRGGCERKCASTVVLAGGDAADLNGHRDDTADEADREEGRGGLPAARRPTRMGFVGVIRAHVGQ